MPRRRFISNTLTCLRTFTSITSGRTLPSWIFTPQRSSAALGIQVEFTRSSDFGFTGSKEGEKIIQLCQAIGCDHLINGPKAAEYMNQELFDAAGIGVRYMTYEYPEYRQLFRPFTHGVSVLDLLFNTGDQAPYYIWGWREEQK